MLKIPVTPDDHIQGKETAPLVLVEYGDYQCPHCGHAYPIVKQLQQHYGDKLAFVYRNFPLNEIHPMAEPAAETAEFAGSKDRFWEMHDAIFENQAELSPELLLALADSFDLSSDALETALEAKEFTPRVRNDFRGGVRSGVNGTPTFFLNGSRYEGPVEFDEMVGTIEVKLMRGK